MIFSTPENAARHLQRPAVSKRPSQKKKKALDVHYSVSQL